MSSDDDLEWTKEDLRFLRRLREQAPNRRDILKGGATLAAGIGMGSAATGATMAQPTGDEGAVGEQNDRVEAWVSEMDANSVDTDEGSIGGNPILGGASTSSTVSYTLGTTGWITIDADNPAYIFARVKVETDGADGGRVDYEVDESGGTSGDLLDIIWVDPGLGSSGQDFEFVFGYVPAGAQIQFSNSTDPTGNNDVQTLRKYVL